MAVNNSNTLERLRSKIASGKVSVETKTNRNSMTATDTSAIENRIRRNINLKSYLDRVNNGEVLEREEIDDMRKSRNTEYYRQYEERRKEEERKRRQWYAETPMQKEMAGFLEKNLREKAYDDAIKAVSGSLDTAREREQETGARRKSAYDAYSLLLSERLQSSFAPRASLEDELLGKQTSNKSLFSQTPSMEKEVLDAYDRQISGGSNPTAALVANGLGVSSNTNPYADFVSKYNTARSDFAVAKAENETAKQNVSALENTQTILQLEKDALHMPKSTYKSPEVPAANIFNRAKQYADAAIFRADAKLGGDDLNSLIADYASDQERDTILRFASNGQWDKVEKYVEAIQTRLTARKQGEIVDYIDELPKVAQIALGTLTVPYAAPLSYAEQVKNAITGQTPDLNAGMTGALARGQFAREQSMEKLSEKGKFLASVGYSMADNALTMALGKTGATIWLGLSAAGAGTVESLEKRRSLGKSFALGTFQGAIEAATEFMGIDNLFRMAKSMGKVGLTSFLLSMAKQGGTEGVEEVVSEFANTLLDMIANGEDSEFYDAVENYRKNGMTEDSAQRQATIDMFFKKPGLAGLAGALSGALFGAGSTALSSYNSISNGKAMKETGAVPDIIQAALNLDPNGEYQMAYQLAQKLESDMRVRGDVNGERLSNGELTALAQMMPQGSVDQIILVTEARKAEEDARRVEAERAAQAEADAASEQQRVAAEAQQNAENEAARIAQSVEYQTAARQIVGGVLSAAERRSYRNMAKSGIDAQTIWDDIVSRHEAEFENLEDADDAIVAAVYNAVQERSVGTVERDTVPNGYTDANARQDVALFVQQEAESAGIRAEAVPSITDAAERYYEAYAAANFSRAGADVKTARTEIFNAVQAELTSGTGEPRTAEAQRITTRITESVEADAKNVGADVPAPVSIPSESQEYQNGGTEAQETRGEPNVENYTPENNTAYTPSYRQESGVYEAAPESGEVNAAGLSLSGAGAQYAESAPQTSDTSGEYKLSKRGAQIRDDALASLRLLVNDNDALSVTDREIEIANIAGKLGVKLKFQVLGDNINGLYKNGVIYLNPQSSQQYTVVFAHELMHLIEQRGAYADIRTIVKNGRRVQETGASWDELVSAMRDQYADSGFTLSRADAEYELIANIVGEDYLSDADALSGIVGANRKLGRVIRDWVNRIVSKLSGEDIRAASDEVNLLRLQAAVEEALSESWNVPETEKRSAAVSQKTEENAAIPQQEKPSVGNFSLDELARAAREKNRGVDSKTADQAAIDRGRETFLRTVGRAYNIPKAALEGEVRDAVKAFDADFASDRDYRRSLHALAKAVITNEGEAPKQYRIEEYQNIRDYLREVPILVDNDIRNAMPDFNDFRKRYMGKVRLTNDGIAVDKVFKELSSMAPGLFNEDESMSKADQILRIAEVADMLFEKVDANSMDEQYRDMASEDRANILTNALNNYFALHSAAKYGTIGPGTQYRAKDNPNIKTDKVSLPRRTSAETRTHESSVTIAEAAATKKAAKKLGVEKLLRQYVADTNADQVNRAKALREKSDSLEAAAQKFVDMVEHPTRRNKDLVDTIVFGEILLAEASEAGNIDVFSDLLISYQDLTFETAKSMQAQTILKKLSPEGQLITMEKTAKRAAEKIRKSRSKSEQREIDRQAQNAKDRSDAAGDIYDLVKEIQKLDAKIKGGLVSQQDGQAQLDELQKELYDRQRQIRKLIRRNNASVDADIADVLSDLYSVTQSIESESSKLDPNLSVLSSLKSELRRKKARLKNLSSLVEAKNSDASRAERNEEIRKVREEIDAANREIDSLTDALGKKDLAEARRQLASAKRRLENLQSTFDERRGAIEAKTDASLKKLNETMKELVEKRGILEDARAKYLEASGKEKQAASELARVNRQIERLNEKIQAMRDKIEETLANLNLANETKPGLETLADTVNMSRKLSKEWQQYITGKGRVAVIPRDMRAEFLSAESDEKRDEIADRIVSIIALQLPGTLREKLRSWRYLSMLCNVRTHMRNIMGNAGMLGAREVKDVFGAGLEFAFRKKITKLGGERTKAVINPASKSDRALLNLAEERFKQIKDVIEGNKYSEADKIEERRRIYESAAMEWIRRKSSGLLSAEDSAAMLVTFRSTYAQYLKANGYTAQDTLDDDFQRRATEYAIKEAQEATFHDASNLARLINKFERSGNVAGFFVGGLMPFKQTPINVAKRMVEYSPTSLIRGTVNLIRANNAQEFIDGLNNLAKGLTGSSIMAIGYFLARAGILVAGGDPDEKEKETSYRKLFGRQMYAINGKGWSYTIDWLAPAAAPLFAGAFLYESLTADGYSPDDVFKVASALASILNPLLELSMLDGISSALKSYESGAQQAVDIGISALTSYLGQYIPTLVGQIARSVDSIQRSTYATGDSTIEKALKRFVLQSAAKIPGLSKLLQPALDAHGNPVERPGGNFFGRLLLNTISPGYLSISSAEDVDRELLRLYEQTGNTGVLPKPSTETTYVTVNGENLKFTEGEVASYFQTYATYAFSELSGIIASDGYKEMTDEEKADLIEGIFSDASDYAKTEFLIERGLYDGIAKEYFDARLYGTAEKERKAPAYMERLRAAPEFSDARLYRIDHENLTNKDGIELYQALSSLEDVSEDDLAFLYLYRAYDSDDSTNAKNAEMISALRSKGISMEEILQAKLAMYDASGNAIDTVGGKAASLRKTSLSSSDKFSMIPYFVTDSKAMSAAIEDARASGMSANKLLEYYEKYNQIKNDGKANKTSASDQNLEWSRYLINLNLPSNQFLSLKENFTFSQSIPISDTTYDKLTSAGVSDKTSAAIVQAVSLLEPEEGKKDVTMYQKAESAYSVASGKEAEEAVKIYLGDSYEKFAEDANKAGVSLEVYVKYRKSISGLEADKDPKTGKTITDSLKKKVCAKIDAIPGLTTAQKDGLFLLKYAKSGLYDTPWH